MNAEKNLEVKFYQEIKEKEENKGELPSLHLRDLKISRKDCGSKADGRI